jgi:hypothetical protein
MTNRRLRRRIARAQRHAKESTARGAPVPDPLGRAPEWSRPAPAVGQQPPSVVVREAHHVERLAYTRTQAAQALGMSRSTFTNRVLSHVETIETPWGARLIPVDELERLVVEWRRPKQPPRNPRRTGRPAGVPSDVVERIRNARAAGLSLRQIAD